MKTVAIVIPIHQARMNQLEYYSVSHSLKVLSGRDIIFVGPSSIGMESIALHFGSHAWRTFDDKFFDSVKSYNKLLLSLEFYNSFIDYDNILILQPDAIVFKDELNYWCKKPFDYVGAPWPDGFEWMVDMCPFAGRNSRRVKVHVGNGGLSFRRVRKCVSLLNEFAEAAELFSESGSAEDIYFSVFGSLSKDFIIPDEVTASQFAMEMKPSYYYNLNGNKIPMGAHAWWTFDIDFWRPLLKEIPIL